MKATEFCSFFDFSIEMSPIEVVPEDEKEELNGKWIYEITDNEGVFHTRYVDKITDITECFDSMIDDYIFGDLSEDKDYDGSFDNLETVLKWLEADEDRKRFYSRHYEVVRCILDPSLIEDNVEEV